MTWFLVYTLKTNFHSKYEEYLILVKQYPLSIQNIHFFKSPFFSGENKITFLSSNRHWIVQFDPMKSNLDFVFR